MQAFLTDINDNVYDNFVEHRPPSELLDGVSGFSCGLTFGTT